MGAQPRIFFAGRYSYRKPSAFVAGTVTVLLGGYALGYLFLSVPHTTWSIKAFGAAAFVGGIGGLLLLCGLVVLRRWIAKTSLALEISATGIRYGEAFHTWSEIRWFSGHSHRKVVQLFYQTRQAGLAGFDRPLPVDRNPTVEEFHDLVEALRCALSDKHPDVEFG